MFSLLSETEGVAVATAPLPAPATKPKFQPMAGMEQAAMPLMPPQPSAPAPSPRAAPMVQAPQEKIQTTLFAAEGRPHSPWAGGAARITAPRPLVQASELGIPTALPEMEAGIEGVRKLLFGKQMGEMQTKVAELQMSLHGEIKRLRDALMGRVDEMSGFLHRDMVVLREEMHGEIAQLKTDLFTAATGLSSVKDRLLTVETRGREEAAAGIAEIEGRLARQETAFATALDNIERKLARTIESKCAEAFAVLARKSDLAAILEKFGSLVEEDKPGVEPGWFCTQPAAAPIPPVTDTWAALAAGADASAKAGDWHPTQNPFFADGNPVT